MAFLYRYRVGVILAIVKFILPFVLQHPIFELHRDEFLYLEQGNHLAWGFMEVPPLLSIFAKFIQLLGGGFFWVKSIPSLIGAFTVFLSCLLAREMGGKTFAQFIAGLSVICGAYLRVNFLFQPNFLEIFFWTLSAFFLIKHIKTHQNKYLYFLAIALGLSFNTKYSVAFFMIGIFVGLVLSNERKIFKNKHFYLALLIFFLMVLPNTIWQYTHNWPIVHHMEELRETQLRFISPADFLKNQVLMHFASFYIWIGGLLWFFLSPMGRPYRIIGIIYLTVIGLLIVTNGKDYYSLGVYPMLFAAGGIWLEQASLSRYWLRYAVVTIMLVLFVPIIPISLPVWKPAKLAAYYKKVHLEKSGALRWEDLQNHPLPQDFADMISWKELATKVSQAYADLPDSSKNNTLLYARNYALAGAITYYGKNLPQVVSDNASFLTWMPEKYNAKNLLFVGRFIPKSDDIVFQQYEHYTILDSITTPMARENGVKIILFENGNNQVNNMIEQGIKKLKAEFKHP